MLHRDFASVAVLKIPHSMESAGHAFGVAVAAAVAKLGAACHITIWIYNQLPEGVNA
jgi:hypothetical protein